eukprot:scaffold12091_cov69-Phaeocystis_antarctica.AAC.4
MHAQSEVGHGRQRARAQPRRQPLHAVGAGWPFEEDQRVERWQHRAQRAQRRQVGLGEALALPARVDLLRLTQLLAAPHPHLAAQRCGRLVLNPQLRPQRLCRFPQPAAGAAEGHGIARLERVAEVGEDDARHVVAERREKNLPRALRPPLGVPQPLVQLLVHIVRNIRVLVDLKPRQLKQVQVDSSGGVSIRILPRGPNEETAVREHADVDQ